MRPRQGATHRLPDAWRVVLLGVALAAATPAIAQQQKRPAVYVGVQVCAGCHDGPSMGHQTARWLQTQHARAYADLAMPEARAIARISGVPVEPLRSPLCLGCHATASNAEDWQKDETFLMREGVQCETCHGPGSEHADAWLRGDAQAAQLVPLPHPSQADCMNCHEEKPSHRNVLGPTEFEIAKALAAIAHPTPEGGKPDLAAQRPSYNFDAVIGPILPPPGSIRETGEAVYKTPISPALSPDGSLLLVTCESSDSIAVIDTATRKKVAEIAVGGQPMDVTFSPDGAIAYATNRLDDTLSVIDVAARRVIATIPVGDEPHGVRTDPSGRTIYVLNTSSDDLSVIDALDHVERNRLAASRGPWALDLSPDGSQLLITNALSRFVPFRAPPQSEATVLDTARSVVSDRVTVPETNLLQGVDWHPSGRFALITLLRTKNLVPMTRMSQGWTLTNGLGVIWADGRVDQVLLDEPGSCFPDPTALAITPDGKHALVTSAGSDRVAVVDIDRLLEILSSATSEERTEILPDHLGTATEYVVAHIEVPANPRGIVIAADGQTAYVACSLADEVAVIDVKNRRLAGQIDLDGPRTITRARWGEQIFHSADIAFQRQLSCNTCHPDGHVDGLTYDIEADGIGMAPIDNRTLRGILDTAPFKWEGTNPSLARQCGPRLSVFFTRIQPFTPEELAAIDHYISTIPRPPNRYRPLGAELTPAQRRGKLMFDRDLTNDGRIIPRDKRCVTCHFPPLFTDRSVHAVGQVMLYDNHADFDVPHLNNIYDSAPYLHNGIADTLEEIWTRYNPEDEHGVTNDMTKDQLNDLIEYLKTL